MTTGNKNNKQIEYTEKVLQSINQALFLDEEKIDKLWYNLMSDFLNFNDNAITVGIVWEWWSWKSSFLNILFETLGDKYYKKDEKSNEISITFKDWAKIENEVKDLILKDDISDIKKLKVLFINSWLIDNIVSEPLLNIVRIINKKLGLNIDDFAEDNNIVWFGKKMINLAWKVAKSLEVSWAKLDIKPFETIYDNIIKMKTEFHEALNTKLEEKKAKLVIIIDDLDRIPPEDAVTILDSIKLFLDNPNIMIFLLNDKDIVKRWLKKKLDLEQGNEADKIAVSYLDKLINVEINVEDYYNEDKFFEDMKEFIKNNEFIKVIDKLSDRLIENEKILEKLYKIKNMRRIKKLFKNFEIQAPSIVDYNNDNDKLEKYYEYFKKMLDNYLANTGVLTDWKDKDTKKDDC